MMLIPIIIQCAVDFKCFNVGVGVIVNPEDNTAGALFHLGLDRDGEMTFDILWLNCILGKYRQ